MSNYIIECRNKEALLLNPSLENGDYNTTIQDKIMLEEGDTIMLKSAYIDTKATSEQKIIIDEPLDLTLDYISYVMNQSGSIHMSSDSQRTILDNTVVPPAPKTEQDPVINDGRLYLMCSKTAGQANLRELKGIQFDVADATKPTFGGFNVFVNFTDANGDKKSIKEQVPIQNVSDGKATPFFNFDCQFLATSVLTITSGAPDNNGSGGDGFVMASTSIPSGAGNAPVSFNCTVGFYKITSGFPSADAWSVDMSGVDHFKAVNSTTNITIEEGNYAPADLCDTINRKLQVIGDNVSGTNLTDNKFLQSVETTTNVFFVAPAGSEGTEPLSGEDIKSDYRYQYNQAGGVVGYNGFYVGASQVVLGFEPNTQKFEWQYIHSPYIASGSEAVGYELFTQNDFPTNTNATFAVNRHAGILFKSLRAQSKKTGLPVSFWDKTLGFDLNRSSPNCILAQYSSILNVRADTGIIGSRRQVFKPVLDPQPAVGTTIPSNYQGIDTAYQKTDKFYLVPDLGQTGQSANTFYSTSLKTNAIVAGDSVLSQDDKMAFGYYLIEVRANFQNNYLTNDENRRNVMGIISRYYVKDAYTSGTSEDSLIYTHSGEPMLLSSFDIRILDSDKVLASNIGSDNTVFLNIIKADTPKKK